MRSPHICDIVVCLAQQYPRVPTGRQMRDLGAQTIHPGTVPGFKPDPSNSSLSPRDKPTA